MGVKVKITKMTDADLNKATVEKLNEKGVLRFPALVTDTGKVRLGLKKIEELFEQNKTAFGSKGKNNKMTKQQAFKGDFASDPNLADYYQKEMSFDALHRDKNNGEKEGFEAGASDDFSKKVADQMRRRKITSNDSPAVGGMDTDMQEQMAKQNEARASRGSKDTAQTNNIKVGNITMTEVMEQKQNQNGGDDVAAGDDIFDRIYMQNAGLDGNNY